MDIVEEGMEEVAMFEDIVGEIMEEGFPGDVTVTSMDLFRFHRWLRILPLVVVFREHTTFYEAVSSGSQRCGDMFVDNQGYSFTVKERNVCSVSWHCKVRNKVCNC